MTAHADKLARIRYAILYNTDGAEVARAKWRGTEEALVFENLPKCEVGAVDLCNADGGVEFTLAPAWDLRFVSAGQTAIVRP